MPQGSVCGVNRAARLEEGPDGLQEPPGSCHHAEVLTPGALHVWEPPPLPQAEH